jgi:hypothetical protein
MKRQLFLATLLGVFLTGSIAQAQDTAPTAPGQRQGAPGGLGVGQRQGAPGGLGVGQRQGGPPPGQGQDAYANTVRAYYQAIPTMTVTTAWWSNNALVTRLGLTDVQKSRIESIFEAHRQSLVSTRGQLEKEESQLSKLLEADSIDRNAAFTQINRVIQARGEMERANSTMTLEMREQLTRAQWTQLQASQPNLRILTSTLEGQLPIITQPPAPGTPGVRGGGGRGPAPPQQ